MLPSTLKLLGYRTFDSCGRLRRVASRRKTQTGPASEILEELHCGELALPAALEKVGHGVFASCENIHVVWAEDCPAIEDVRRDNDWVAVLPTGLAMGGTLLRPQEAKESGSSRLRSEDRRPVVQSRRGEERDGPGLRDGDWRIGSLPLLWAGARDVREERSAGENRRERLPQCWSRRNNHSEERHRDRQRI